MATQHSYNYTPGTHPKFLGQHLTNNGLPRISSGLSLLYTRQRRRRSARYKSSTAQTVIDVTDYIEIMAPSSCFVDARWENFIYEFTISGKISGFLWGQFIANSPQLGITIKRSSFRDTISARVRSQTDWDSMVVTTAQRLPLPPELITVNAASIQYFFSQTM